MNILVLILVGLLVGVLAKFLMGGSFGWVISIILGVVGVFLGGWIFGQLNIAIGTPLVSQIIGGVIGACLILFVGRLVFKKGRRR